MRKGEKEESQPKLSQETSVERDRRFQAAFEHAPIGISLTGVNGNLDWVNPAFCNIVDYTKEELAKHAYPKITHPDDIAESKEFIRSILAGERSHQCRREVVSTGADKGCGASRWK